MNAIGWILIFLLILGIGAGIFLLIWYFAKIKPDQDKKNQGQTGQTGPTPPPPPPDAQKLSILTAAGAPQYGMTNTLSYNVVLRDPQGPTGGTGAAAPAGPTGFTEILAPNICSRYVWLYNGGTGTVGPIGTTGPTGPTGTTGTITGGTGSFLQANWETNTTNAYLRVNTSTTPKAGDTLITGATGPTGAATWLFVPTTPSATIGKWCLKGVTDRLLCLHYSGVGGENQPLTIQEFKINNTDNENDKGFLFSSNDVLSSSTTPTCNAG